MKTTRLFEPMNRILVFSTAKGSHLNKRVVLRTINSCGTNVHLIEGITEQSVVHTEIKRGTYI